MSHKAALESLVSGPRVGATLEGGKKGSRGPWVLRAHVTASLSLFTFYEKGQG